MSTNVIYADLKCLVNYNISFQSIKKKHDVYRGKDCIKKFAWIYKRAHNKGN